MSSAILYGAIVVIWAGVLIPRWLRRETTVATPEPVADQPDQPVSRREERPAPAPRRDSERARVIRARRRLLGMLLALAFSAAALAQTGLAAWWVVLPPAVMLLGYLALLREASRADAERRSAQRSGPTASSRMATAPARAPAAPATASPASAAPVASPASAAPVASPASAAPAMPAAPAAPAASAAPAPLARPVAALDAQVIDITARVGEEFYDQYADAKLRAVGD